MSFARYPRVLSNLRSSLAPSHLKRRILARKPGSLMSNSDLFAPRLALQEWPSSKAQFHLFSINFAEDYKPHTDSWGLLPDPVSFQVQSVGGSPMMVTSYLDRDIFLTMNQHAQLANFVKSPSDHTKPKCLFVNGPVLSGKTVLLNHILPGMVSKAYLDDSSRPRPIAIDLYWPMNSSPKEACSLLGESIQSIAFGYNIQLDLPSDPIFGLPKMVAQLAAAVAERNGELWLTFDEHNQELTKHWRNPLEYRAFFSMLRELVRASAPHRAHVVISGLAIIDMMRGMQLAPSKDGFNLWDSCDKLHLGDSLNLPAFQEVTQRFLSTTYFRETPETLCPDLSAAQLARDFANGGCCPGVMGTRRELLEHVVELTDWQAGMKGFQNEFKSVAFRVWSETVVDVAKALHSFDRKELNALHTLATSGLTMSQLTESHTPHFQQTVMAMCEQTTDADAPLTLLPPYGKVLRDLIRPNMPMKYLAQIKNEKIVFPHAIYEFLTLLEQDQEFIPYEIKAQISEAVVEKFSGSSVKLAASALPGFTFLLQLSHVKVHDLVASPKFPDVTYAKLVEVVMAAEQALLED